MLIKFIGTNSLLEGFEKGSFKELIRECKIRGSVSVDTETSGLNFLDDFIILASFGWKDLQFVVDARYVSLQPLIPIFEDRSIVKIFQNAKFDIKFFMKTLKCRFENVYDVMLVEQIISTGYQNLRYDLVSIAQRRLGIVIDKKIRSSFHQNPNNVCNTAQITYAAKDVEHLEEIKTSQLQAIRTIDMTLETNLRSIANLENNLAVALAEMEYEGITVSSEAWLKLARQSEINLIGYRGILDALVLSNPKLCKFVPKYIQSDIFCSIEELRKIDVNWDSPKQVQIVFSVLTDTLISSVEERELQPFSSHQLIKEYINYKGTAKLASAYGKAFLNHIYSDGKIHTSFYQILSTGRMSSSEPNMQQIPQTKEYRNAFITGDPDYVFVSCDYSSQELSIIALKSMEPVWIEALQTGKDLHSLCAELVFEKKWADATYPGCAYQESKVKCECPGHKKLRTLIKTINFGLAYGMTEYKFSNTAQISVEEASSIITKYFKTFPKIKSFLEQIGAFGVKKGYITTFYPYRRIRWFTDILQGNPTSQQQEAVRRRAKNTPIQGCGADMMKIAIVAARNWLKSHPDIRAKLVMTIHDQLDSVCHKDDVEVWAPVLKKLMEESALPMFMGGEIKAELKISEVWEK